MRILPQQTINQQTSQTTQTEKHPRITRHIRILSTSPIVHEPISASILRNPTKTSTIPLTPKYTTLTPNAHKQRNSVQKGTPHSIQVDNTPLEKQATKVLQVNQLQQHRCLALSLMSPTEELSGTKTKSAKLHISNRMRSAYRIIKMGD